MKKILLILMIVVPFLVEGQTLLRKEQIEPLGIDTTASDINRNNWEVYLNGLINGDNWGSDVVVSDATLTGNGTSLAPLHVVHNDNDSTNEIQTISKTGSTVTLSGGGGSFTDSDTQLSEATVDSYADNNGYLTSEVQNLNDVLTIGNTSTLGATFGDVISNSRFQVTTPSGGAPHIFINQTDPADAVFGISNSLSDFSFGIDSYGLYGLPDNSFVFTNQTNLLSGFIFGIDSTGKVTAGADATVAADLVRLGQLSNQTLDVDFNSVSVNGTPITGGTYTAGAGLNLASNIFSLDVNSLPLDNGMSASPFFAIYNATDGNIKTEISQFDADYFGSGSAVDGLVLTSDGVGGAAWEAPGTGGSTDYINAASFSTSTGVLTLSGVGLAGASVDLDNRYLTGNQTITLGGDLSGSGTTSITATIASDAVESTMLNDNVISGLATGTLSSADEFMLSDGGLLRNTPVSALQTYMQNNLNFGTGTDDQTAIEVPATDNFTWFNSTNVQDALEQIDNLLNISTYTTVGRAAFDSTDFYIYNGLVSDRMNWRTNTSFTATATTQTISIFGGAGSFDYYGKISIMVVDTEPLSDVSSVASFYANADMQGGTFERSQTRVIDDDTPVVNITCTWVDNGANGSLNINLSGLTVGRTYNYSYKSETIRYIIK